MSTTNGGVQYSILSTTGQYGRGRRTDDAAMKGQPVSEHWRGGYARHWVESWGSMRHSR